MRLAAIALAACALGLVTCDWFEAQPDDNLPPDTELVLCGASGEIEEGQTVTFRWSATDLDGEIQGYQWAYDGSEWAEVAADSVVVGPVAVGEHTFRVRAYDNKGDADPTPGQCSFTALAKGVLVERTVLAEMFTTNICRNCDKAEAALDSLVGEFGADRLVVAAYHDKPSGAPGSDGLATDETDARVSWYTANPAYLADQWPIAVFDGVVIDAEGAVTIEAARTRFRDEIAARLEVGSPIRITVAGEITAAGGSVTAAVKATGRPPSHPLVLRLAVIEDDVFYAGRFATIFDFVTRDILPDQPLELGAVGDSVLAERDFSVPEAWDPANMDVVVFVQDETTREIIQAARLRRD